MKRIIAEIDDTLHQKLKEKSVKEKTSIKEIVIRLITKLLKGDK